MKGCKNPNALIDKEKAIIAPLNDESFSFNKLIENHNFWKTE
jgi:hypothetical protein